jgi:hypothetical protein
MSDDHDDGSDASLQAIAESLDDPECTEHEPTECRAEDGEAFGYE